MKSFQQIQEERGERAFKQAMSMGLKYGGFGYWKDPQTNETVYKTENDTLVKVEPREESELAAKGGPDDGGGRPDAMSGGAAGGAGGGGMAGAAGMLQMPGAGQAEVGGLGAGAPGEAKVAKERGWEPGPDGDTCVGPEAEEPGKVPEDSFVGRTNFLKWKAGPDGDNINTVSLGMVKEQIRQVREGKEMDAKNSADVKIMNMLAGEKRSKIGRITAGKIRRMVDRGSGKADELAKAGIERPGTQQGPRQDGPHPGAGTMMRQAMGAQKRPETDAPFGKTIKDARGAVDKLKQGGHDVILGNQIADMMRIKNKGPKWNQGTLDNANADEEKQNNMWQKLTRLPAISKDAEAVKQMNIEARDLVQDPDYKMDQYDDEEYGDDYLSEGAFGQVFQDRNGNIVKKGGLGPSELKALFAMKDNPAFPNLINAQFDEPFIHKSSVENNSRGRRTNERATGVEEYWEPDDQSEWDRQFPTAQGTYAMSPAKGEELFSGIDSLDDDMKDKVMRNFWKARGDLHKAGFSHNDMHGGNIFMDPETGEVNIIDLGLAKENKLSALMEGLGGLDFEEGQDYQLNHHMGGSNFSERMQEVSVNNRANIEQEIMDNLDIDMDDEDGMEASMEAIRQMMTGDIRMRDDDFDNIKESIPYLADDENVDKLIKMLYDGIGNSELADRMGDAFEKKQLDTKVLKAANLMRKQKGQSQITPKKSVIPPENMDFDD